jgi:hypothetical protein
MARFSLQGVRVFRGLALLAVAWSVCSCTPVQAQLNFGAFTLKFTEKEMNLEHPSDMDWQKYLMWDLPFQRMNDRNMPYLELTNHSDSSAPITEFHLTIGDERFNFTDKNMGEFAKLAKTTNNFDIDSSTLNGAGDELIVDINNGGLSPGQTIRFRIDLEVDDAYKGQFFAHPDYRTVLFDMNGLNVYSGFLQQFSSDDNAKATAIYDPTSGPNFSVGPWAVEDEIVAGPAADFYNDNYRKYRDNDPVRTFLVVGTSEGAIPEPGCAALVGIGVVGGLLTMRRKRRTSLVAA